MILLSLVTLLVLCIGINSQSVFNLDSENFDSFLENEPLALVNFYAPWCVHCKALTTVLDNVAHEIFISEIPGFVATFDATLDINEDISEREEIEGYPTLVLYKYGQKMSEYHGNKIESDIIEFLRLKSEPAAKRINSYAELEPFINNLEANKYQDNLILSIVLGCFTSLDSHESRVHSNMLLELAADYDMSLFFVTDSEDLLSHYRITQDSLVIITSDHKHVHIGVYPFIPVRNTPIAKEENVSFVNSNSNSNDAPSNETQITENSSDASVSTSTTTTVETLKRYILDESLPTILTYNSDSQSILSQLPIREHVLLFYNSSESLQVEFVERVESLASQYKGQLVFIEVECSEYQILDFFDVKPLKLYTTFTTDVNTNSDVEKVEFLPALPALIVADMRDPHDMRKYSLGEEVVRQVRKQRAIFETNIKESQSDTDTATNASISLTTSLTELTTDELDHFLTEYLRGTLTRSFLTQDESSLVTMNANMESTFVENIVSSNYKEKVLDPVHIDALVYVHAPWCAHCKSIEPIVTAVARSFSEDSRVRVFRIDGAKNDLIGRTIYVNSTTPSAAAASSTEASSGQDKHSEDVQVHNEDPVYMTQSSVKISGFPTLILYTSSKHSDTGEYQRKEPIEYDGDRTVDAIVGFINAFRSV